MKLRYQYFANIAWVMLILFLGSCTKTIDGIVDDATINRAFIPSNLKARTAVDSAIITWNLPVLGSGKKYTYTVDISKDSLFNSIDLTKIADTTGLVILEPVLNLANKYFVRVKVNAYKEAAESRYLTSPVGFTINGQQFLKVIRDHEVTLNSLLLHWFTNANTAGVDKVILVPIDGGTPIEVAISQGEAIAGEKLISGLTPNKMYRVQLLAAGKSKGLTTIKTQENVIYNTTVNAGADLVAVLNAAADGDIIGLNPGVHTLAGLYNLVNKSVTIRSTSSNPSDTKIKLREFSLVGDGAGVTFAGLDIDGNYSGTSIGVQFLQLKGSANANGAAATFKNIVLDNCNIHDYSRCFLLGNLGTAVNDHKMGNFLINNCRIYNIDRLSTGTYYTFSMEKLAVNSFTLRKSTVYAVGQGLINMSTNGIITAAIPTVIFDFNTFNNIGGGSGKQYFIDANTNRVALTISNNIFANSPIAGSLAGSYRATNSSAGNIRSFVNNNYFKFYSSLANSPLPLTGLDQVSNLQLDLGWTPTTINFLLSSLPASHPVFRASRNGTTIGDPRWAY